MIGSRSWLCCSVPLAWTHTACWSDRKRHPALLLQAEVCYLEAKACAVLLSQQGVVPLPPVGASDASEAATTAGSASQEAPTTSELQLRITAALLKGMQLAQAAEQHWLVANGASEAWAVYMPALLQQQYSRLQSVLQPALSLLLQLPEVNVPSRLLSSIAEAAAKAVEHSYLLDLLAAAARSDIAPAASSLATARQLVAALEPGKVTAQQQQALQAPLAQAAAAAEAALARMAGGEAQPQALVEAYAKLQAVRCQPVKLAKVSSRDKASCV